MKQRFIYEYKSILLLLLLLCCIEARGADGDVFTANTVEGVKMTFKVLSESAKTCQVGEGIDNGACVLYTTSGSITIPQTANNYTVTSIGSYAFIYCLNLTTIIIPNSVTTIRSSAFYCCTGLTSINIPNSVTTIESCAFQVCIGLKNVFIPNSVTSIGSYAFAQCTKLKNAIFKGDLPATMETSVFDGVTGATLYVPATYYDHYTAQMSDGKFYDGEFTLQTFSDDEEPKIDGDCLVEYFINTDPGIGKGIKVQADIEGNIDFNLPLDELAEGLNVLGLRPANKNEDGTYTYSSTMLRDVYKYRSADGIALGAEWFLNNDPGVGKAHPVEATSDGNMLIDLPVNEMLEGLNILGLRAIGQDKNGTTYGNTVISHVYRHRNNDATAIGTEWFLNTDPGVGKGYQAQATSEGSVEFELPLDEMHEGVNILGLRPIGQDCKGIVYGSTVWRFVYKPATLQQIPIDMIEYFWDNDPGKGKGTRIAIEPQNEVTLTEMGIAHEGLFGSHTLYVRAKAGDAWTELQSQEVTFPDIAITGNATLDWEQEDDIYHNLFQTLQSLFTAISGNMDYLSENDFSVDVADGNYTCEIAAGSPIKQTLSSMAQICEELNLSMSMTAHTEAIFSFVLTGNYTEVDRVQTMESIQTLMKHTGLMNIIVLIDGQPYEEEPEVEPNDLVQLKNLYAVAGGEKWTRQWNIKNNGRFKKDFPGVTFNDDGRVTAINLTDNNLTGDLTLALPLYLPYLQELNLSRNHLHGDLNHEFLVDADGMQLKLVNVSYNNLSEVSHPLPQSITSLYLDHQNYVYGSSADNMSDYLSTIVSDGLPMQAYISLLQNLGMPTIFTYNHAARDYSLKPTWQLANYDTQTGSTTSVFGHLSYDEDEEAYYYVHTSVSDYQNPQDATVVMSCDRGCYPATLSYEEGDANMSGATDVLDVQRTLNYALITQPARGVNRTQPYSNFNYSAANTFADDIINVQDIVCTVNIILNDDSEWGEESAEARIRASRQMRVNRDEAVFTAQGADIVMSTQAVVAAIAIELKGVTTDEVSLLVPSTQWQFKGRNVVGGSRYVIFSPTGQTLPCGITPILRMAGNGEPVAAQCADADAQPVPAITNNGETTDLQLPVNAPQAEQTYDLQGRKQKDGTPLKKGVYIVDGHKKVVR